MKSLMLAAALTLGILPAAYACTEELEVTDAWIRPTPGGKDVTAAFFTVTNNGAEAHKLTGVTVPGAQAEMHTTVEENGVFRMRHLHEVEIPAGGTVEFKPHSMHVMIMKQQEPLKEGDTAPLTLHCEDGSLAVAAPVKARP